MEYRTVPTYTLHYTDTTARPAFIETEAHSQKKGVSDPRWRPLASGKSNLLRNLEVLNLEQGQARPPHLDQLVPFASGILEPHTFLVTL